MAGLIIIALILVVGFIVVAPIVALVAQSQIRKQIGALTLRIAGLERTLSELSDRDGPEPHAIEAGSTPPVQEGAVKADAPPEPVAAQPKQPEDAAPSSRPQAAAGTITPSDSEYRQPEPSRAPKKPRRSLEETIASQWMIWLGGVTVALSAVFLFRYAVDQGWLTPLLRVVLGLLLGGALLAGGEWAQRRPEKIASRLPGPNYIPPALTAAGIFAVFVSLFAAHALFGLLNATTAFITLGMAAYAALALSLRQGWFVALLGVLAGYLVPALIDTPDPNAAALFLYLLVLSAGALAVMVWRQWWWFSALALAGALLWPVLWIFDYGVTVDQGILSAYALGLATLCAAFSTKLPLKEPETQIWQWLVAVVADTSGLGFALSGVLIVLLAIIAGFNAPAFMFLGLYAAIAFAMGLWRDRLEGLFLITAILVFVTFLIWPQPAEISDPSRVQELGVASVSNAFGPFVMPPEFFVFSRALWAFAALFGLGGFVALRWGRTVAVWAGVSALMPVVLFAIGYWRIGAFEIDVAWAGFAVGLSALMFLAAASAGRMTGTDRRDLPLALYAAACTAAVALAFVCVLREAWLTVGLAAEIAALGWIWTRLPVRELRPIAAVLLFVVILRLVGNPLVLSYEGTVMGVFGWVIYGYGLPAILIFAAAHFFRRGDTNDLLVTFCEIAALGLAFLMVALQLKLWTSGAIFTQRWEMLDIAVQSLWWLVAAGLFLRDDIASRRPWLVTAGLGVLGMASLLIFGGQVIASNPLFRRMEVGNLPLINLLGLAYLAPAILLGVISTSRFHMPAEFRKVLRGGAGLLVFVYLTLETRRAFQGSDIMLTRASAPANGEIYAYSAVWIVFSLAILALAILRGSQALRYASLAVLIVTVAKVFLYDMSDLTGLFRVASFLGLGLTLIGIGGIYRRFVFSPPEPVSDPEPGL